MFDNEPSAESQGKAIDTTVDMTLAELFGGQDELRALFEKKVGVDEMGGLVIEAVKIVDPDTIRFSVKGTVDEWATGEWAAGTAVEATYFDCSGSMHGHDLDALVASENIGQTFWFTTFVSEQRPAEAGGGTKLESVLVHAKEKGFTRIRIVSDGFFENSGTLPQRRIRIDGMAIELVIRSG
ncbi:hypothetical protein LCGC14_0243730 [marine sediment metagenome]|uniref:Uncharacterized protein n=1 Tax=marine sediment metagenome TaxID=412755 RepID=A0A0F9WRC6_9ZZZZ